MDIDSLKLLRDEAEKQFVELTDEQKRLQGEFRLLNKLIATLEETKLKEAEDATNTTE